VYINDTPGKGEVGTDMKSIPFSAIERVKYCVMELLPNTVQMRLQGVNIILKKKLH
jgi:iron complex outermembrane receptor protein